MKTSRSLPVRTARLEIARNPKREKKTTEYSLSSRGQSRVRHKKLTGYETSPILAPLTLSSKRCPPVHIRGLTDGALAYQVGPGIRPRPKLGVEVLENHGMAALVGMDIR